MASDEELSDDHLELQNTYDEQSECKFIAERAKQYPEMLEKSQLPSKKGKKQAAIDKVVTEYRQLYGREITSKALLKKVGNMKTRLKNKTDKNKTGNKRLPALLPWETILMEAMHADVNPTVAKIPGGLELGAPLNHNRDTIKQPPPQPPVLNDKQKLPRTEAMAQEAEETRKLTNSQLQRLVLLEQLKVARLQQEYFSAKIKNRVSSTPVFLHENEKTFQML